MTVIKRADALMEVTKTGSTENDLQLEAQFQKLEDQRLQTALDRDSQLGIMDMRKRWSGWILFTIVVIVVFNIFVIIMTGFRMMEFSSDIVLPFFLGESLLQTIGLAAIIVKFLFHKDSLGNPNHR